MQSDFVSGAPSPLIRRASRNRKRRTMGPWTVGRPSDRRETSGSRAPRDCRIPAPWECPSSSLVRGSSTRSGPQSHAWWAGMPAPVHGVVARPAARGWCDVQQLEPPRPDAACPSTRPYRRQPPMLHRAGATLQARLAEPIGLTPPRHREPSIRRCMTPAFHLSHALSPPSWWRDGASQWCLAHPSVACPNGEFGPCPDPRPWELSGGLCLPCVAYFGPAAGFENSG